MRGAKFPVALAAAVIGATAAGVLWGVGNNAKPTVGEEAPGLSPSEWLNGKSTVSWDKLKGRVILIENWATT